MLVHLYWQVDNQRVYQILQGDVGDLDVFTQQIAGRL
ncbi:MAG: HepT-like ribonuclease domain-containing protein [Chloroflexota bacterium]